MNLQLLEIILTTSSQKYVAQSQLLSWSPHNVKGSRPNSFSVFHESEQNRGEEGEKGDMCLEGAPSLTRDLMARPFPG